MSITNYNIPPYYDDFDPAKNYVRVLFRPGYAVQARELTQLQTAISAQIERFGSHIFKEGSVVLGGEAVLDTKYAYVKLETTFSYNGTTYYPEGNGGGNLAYYQNSIGQVLTGAGDAGASITASGITATVLEITTSNASDSLTAFVRYDTAATNNTGHFFTAGEFLTFLDSQTGATRRFKVRGSAYSPVGYGTRASVNSGVYFVKGNFVYTPEASVIISKYDSAPSARVVYTVSENIVTTAEDATLVDNSLGTPNSSAPGAHRYQIAMDLVVEPYSLDARTEDNIIQVLLVIAGNVSGRARTEYSELAKTLATRTFEESGNYTVRPFKINVREFYNDGTNGGLYTQTQIQSLTGLTGQNAIDYGKARLAVGLEPAVAYVSGYRIETMDTNYVPVEKARDEGYLNLASIFAPLGGYVYIDTIVGLPDTTTYSQITLKNGSGTAIGTARARAIEYVSGTAPTALYKLYLFDINVTSGTFAQIRTIEDITVPGKDFSATINDIDPSINDAILYDTSTSSLIYKLPVNAVQSLRETGGTIGFLYKVRRKYDIITAASGNLVINSASDTFESTTATDYVVVKADAGSNGQIIALSGTPVISGAGHTVTLPIGAGYNGQTFIVSAPSSRNLQEKQKILNSDYAITVASPNTTPGSYDILNVTDLLRVKHVWMSPNLSTAATGGANDVDIADRYDVDNGQRENFYGVARIRLKPGASAPIGQLRVVVDYFSHQPGDYFCVDSYADIAYEDIPSFDSIKGKIELRDAVDFRPCASRDGTTFDPTDAGHPGASVSNTILPNSTIYTDIQYYLPRTDKIYVTKIGQFSSAKGISSTAPAAPADPDDSMVLYTITLGAYTFGPTDTIVKAIDNRRYTMRDIGRLEKRLSNVEYYTSLSLLEKETSAKQILTSSGVPRYKNGFVVDNFVAHNIGAVQHPDYHCSIDTETGTLRPEFYKDYVDLLPDIGASTGITKSDSLVTLSYGEVLAVSQPYSSVSEYVNPHGYYGWKGYIQMSPPGDDWKETFVKPELAANADSKLDWFYSVNTDAAAKTVWNDWQTKWYGAAQQEDQGDAGTTLDSTNAISAQTSGTRTRSGSATLNSGTYNLTTTESYTDTILDTSEIPYIRSRKVYFRVTGLKPNSRVYPFFDGIDISNYTREEASFVDYTTRTVETNYLGYTSHPDGSTDLISDASGTIIGSFIIPNNDNLKFRTGTRTFRLIDNQANNTSTSFTSAELTYYATGVIETHQNTVTRSTVITTIPPRIISLPTTSFSIPLSTTNIVSGLSIEGRQPRYSGIGFNFILDANIPNTSSGVTIASIQVQERGNAADGVNFGNWVPLALQSGGGNSYSQRQVWRITPANPATYQVRGVIGLSNGTTQYSNTVTFTVTQTPDDLVGQYSATDLRFYF